MYFIRKSSRLIGVLILMILLVASGCKSKKKAAEAARAAEERARIEQEANLKRQQEEEARRKQAEADEASRNAESKDKAKYTVLGQYFDNIANSGNTAAANSSINEVLSMFASPDTPVLIVISESGGQKDYDRPTTIANYLNYLKDQKKNANKISNLQFDSSGKIIEVELRKN
jgi:hypothetical protein